jgi:hypothetical protein
MNEKFIISHPTKGRRGWESRKGGRKKEEEKKGG